MLYLFHLRSSWTRCFPRVLQTFVPYTFVPSDLLSQWRSAQRRSSWERLWRQRVGHLCDDLRFTSFYIVQCFKFFRLSTLTSIYFEHHNAISVQIQLSSKHWHPLYPLNSFDITLTIETAGRSLAERQMWRDWRGMLPKCIDPIAPTFRPGWSLWTLSVWIENFRQTEHMHESRPFIGSWDILQHIDSRRLSFCWLRIPIDHHKLFVLSCLWCKEYCYCTDPQCLLRCSEWDT